MANIDINLLPESRYMYARYILYMCINIGYQQYGWSKVKHEHSDENAHCNWNSLVSQPPENAKSKKVQKGSSQMPL